MDLINELITQAKKKIASLESREKSETTKRACKKLDKLMNQIHSTIKEMKGEDCEDEGDEEVNEKDWIWNCDCGKENAWGKEQQCECGRWCCYECCSSHPKNSKTCKTCEGFRCKECGTVCQKDETCNC